MSFTKEEIKIAKQTRDVIISEDVEELKAVYMAGEICMWDELQQEQANGDKSKKSVGVDTAMIKLMIEYETECYNDSTQATYDFYVWDNDTIKSYPSIDPGFTPGYIGTKMIYEHKEPTFKDFVRWVANKYGL